MPSWTVTQPPAAMVPPKDVEAQVLGRDIAFDRGDFIISSARDYATVEGEANVRLSLRRRITSPAGSFVFRPTYGAGLVEQVNRPLDQGTRELTANRVRAQALADARVVDAEAVIDRRGVDVARILLRARLRQIQREPKPLEFSL